MGTSAQKLFRTPLYETHRSLGARMIEFYGWEMPVEYTGIIEEHKAVRASAGLFDVTHMNKLKVIGAGALEFLQWISTNDISKMSTGGMRYSVVCRDDGTFVDDIVVIMREDHYLLITNTSRKEVLMHWLSMHPAEDVRIEDVTCNLAVLAFQGPRSVKIVQELSEGADKIRFWSGAGINIAGVDTYTTRSGYTGEDGFEIYCSPGDAVQLWTSIMDAGSVRPVGLGARDTLRLEMGYRLSGLDLSDHDNPLEAGLEWAVKWRKDFIGKDALLSVKDQGVKKMLVGIRLDRGIPRHGYDIVSNGEKIGTVTSGTISPTLNAGIGLGYVRPEYALTGMDIGIMRKDKVYSGKVVTVPFLEAAK